MSTKFELDKESIDLDKLILNLNRFFILGKDIYDKCNKGEAVTPDELQNRITQFQESEEGDNFNFQSDFCSIDDIVKVCQLKDSPSDFQELYENQTCGAFDNINQLIFYGYTFQYLSLQHLLYIYEKYEDLFDLTLILHLIGTYEKYCGVTSSLIEGFFDDKKVMEDLILLNIKRFIKYFDSKRLWQYEGWRKKSTKLIDKLYTITVIGCDSNFLKKYYNLVKYFRKIFINLFDQYYSQQGQSNDENFVNFLLEDLAQDVNNFTTEYDLSSILDPYLYELLQQKQLIDTDINYQEYKNELHERHIQQETGLEGVNVHTRSTNIGNNRIINKLFQTEEKQPVRDILDEEKTIEAANEFIQLLNENGINKHNITVDQILLCKNYFYDYADKLLGRDRTPPGQGVETCNIFWKIWNQAKTSLSAERLKDFSIRLSQEMHDILNPEEHPDTPVCSTGWATRLINSTLGTVDLGYREQPDLKIIKKEFENWIESKYRSMEEGEEKEKFGDSFYALLDDYEYTKDWVSKNKGEFIDKIFNEYRESGIPKWKINSLLNQYLKQLE